MGAQKSILLEIYGLVDDEAGTRFIEALLAKVGSGVDVIIIVDGIGSKDLSDEAEVKMRAAGVKFVWHNKINWSWRTLFDLPSVWYRNHKKLLIIDEDRVFVGGVNVRADGADWYDLHLEVAGVPDIAMLVHSFAKSYIRSGGARADVRPYLRNKYILRRNRNVSDKVHFVVLSPFYNLRHPFYLRRLYWRALNVARTSFNLVTPYFVPDNYFLKLIKQAIKRGVAVNIILPWRPDHAFMQWISHGFYALTAKLGSAIYFLKIMNHAKAFSADDSFGMVGSANLTPRSFFINHEICAYFTDRAMVRDLNNIFEVWKKESTPLSDLNWGKRGWMRRAREWWMEKMKDYV